MEENKRRFSLSEWTELSEYNLPKGTLLKLNMKLYKGMCSPERMKVMRYVNDNFMPLPRKGVSIVKLDSARLAQIMSGEKYNTHIINAILDIIDI